MRPMTAPRSAEVREGGGRGPMVGHSCEPDRTNNGPPRPNSAPRRDWLRALGAPRRGWNCLSMPPAAPPEAIF
ncbi:uncharacterized protein SCHCODRAFT_01263310 [Schizophyllum commune H4-8]|uniref:uncharacterized protein n=1 Tax=Schizophyllum commune (strain H4-8 / FGSC 9210) TaxID=578458 RepID=UPI00215E69B5|nr:uncharacterized protein SCHCODRAFT_01263310 [Schizophyllum commune H4-8]KAI5886697.1 hypothetical protein SCHCODRAFT_01263310 [Schizophyllum commune H4-8]